MKPKTTLTLFVMLIIVGAFYWLWGVKGAKQRAEKQELAQKIVAVEPDSVDSVTLIQNGDTTVVYQRQDGKWAITYPVNTAGDQTQIDRNLNAFLDAQKQRTIATELTDLKPYGLDTPRVEVGITYNDTGKVTLLVGKENPTGSHVYVKARENNAIYTSDKNLATEGQKKLFDLRDRSIVEFDRNQIQKMIIARNGGQSLEFDNMNGDWRLKSPQVKAQSSQVSSVLSGLSNGQAQTYFEETPQNLAKYGLKNPRLTLSLFANDSTRTAALQIGDPVDDSDSPDYYARDISRPTVFSISNYLVSNLQKTPFEFQDKGLFDISSGQVTDVEITREDTTYALSKVDTAWQLTEPLQAPADPEQAEAIARALTNLRVDSLASYTRTAPGLYGLNHPPMEVHFKVAGSDFDGFRIGRTGQGNMRFISTDSSPYVYLIKENKLNDFRVSLESLRSSREPDSTAIARQ